MTSLLGPQLPPRNREEMRSWSADTAFTGGVLAGGMSERMGSPKAELVLADKKLIDYSLEALRSMRPPPAEVIVAVAPGSRVAKQTITSGRARLSALNSGGVGGVRVVEDSYPHQGPLQGLLTLLEASSTPTTVALACDTPHVGPAVLEHLLGVFGSAKDALAATYQSGGRTHPFPGVYSADLREVVAEALSRGERSVVALLARVPSISIPLPGWAPPYSLESINTPEDFRRALSRM